MYANTWCFKYLALFSSLKRYNSKTVVLGQLIFNIITTRWILPTKPTECSSKSKVPSSTIEDTAVDLATVI